ncbi:alpha/beta hydrolase [Amycolatopsis sp. EV170708-02-1]|uniref:alpha/beta hydrolase n=1 Tax=Amycolatopsis sp. EV170708-02-1 TaxID=2919322 RepID=UPI001F0C0BD0|nr:alpha/beta hydrolase [Amycolatopsis sp. EV170708-02-1]UMP02071.1 alpha/beta hydrolase [Amycolatopsis sp. EV170708-02-1]
MRPLIVLHGSWHQPAHFDDVVGRLRREGVEVTVPDLGARPIAETTRTVQEIVDKAAEPPVVLGHSFGGLTASGLQGAAHLIYLAAIVSEPGETAQYWIERTREETGREPQQLPLIFDDEGWTHLDLAAVREAMYADCTDAVAERAMALLRPEPVTIFDESPEGAAWKDTPTTYITCTEDRALVPEMVAHFADRCETTVTWRASHSPYLSRPVELATLVLERL